MVPRGSFSCPHCDADVPARALACPECGSDAESGWSDDADAWAGGLPAGYGDDDDFDENEFLREEGLAADGRPSSRTRRRRFMLAVVLLLVACLLMLWTLR